MSKMKNKLGMGASLLITVLAFGAFAGAAAVVTQNQFSLAPTTLADEGEDDGGDDQEDDSEDDNNDEEKAKEKEKEKVKKEQEKEREKAKKESEKSRESSGKEDDGEDDDGVENENEDEDEPEDSDEDESEDDDGMFKDRDKTLEKLQEKIAEAEKHILEKQAEGVDVTTALASLAAAKAGLGQVGSAFDANDLAAAENLAKQIKKLAHFTEKDLEYAEKITEEMAKVEKRFGQVVRKIAVLEALGGDASAFKAQLASLRADFSALKASIAADPSTITRDIEKAFEKKVKRLKSLVETAIFAYGGTDEDDDLFEDHEEDADDLAEDLDDVAEIEDGDDDGVSVQVRRVAAEHKAAAQTVKQSLEDIKDRSGLVKALFGPDFSALDTLSAQVAAMNARAAALESAAAQVADPEIRQILTDQADVLRSEALKLQSYIAAEDDQFSIFGALLRLFR